MEPGFNRVKQDRQNKIGTLHEVGTLSGSAASNVLLSNSVIKVNSLFLFSIGLFVFKNWIRYSEMRPYSRLFNSRDLNSEEHLKCSCVHMEKYKITHNAVGI